MKIDPKKNYKKPLYLIGVASLVGVTALCGTGCGDDLQIAGNVPTSTTTELILEGEAQTIETEPPIELEGDVTIDQDYYDENGKEK